MDSVPDPAASIQAKRPIANAPNPAVATGAQPSSTSPESEKVGRRSRFTAADDLIIIREVAAAKAHIAPNGETEERFEIASIKANATKKLTSPVTWKYLQDRYKRLQQRFDECESREGNMSGVGGEIGEMDELLSSMKEARDDLERCKTEKREKQIEKERKQERLGAIIRERATKRKESSDEISSEDVDDVTTRSAKKPKRANSSVLVEDDDEVFTKALQENETRGNELEIQRLEFEKERFNHEKEERSKDRQERKEERESSARLELEEFKILMNMFRTDTTGGGPAPAAVEKESGGRGSSTEHGSAEPR